MMATTMSSSIRVKPSFFRMFFTKISLSAHGPEGPDSFHRRSDTALSLNGPAKEQRECQLSSQKMYRLKWLNRLGLGVRDEIHDNSRDK
jgi:hypothetical protein